MAKVLLSLESPEDRRARRERGRLSRLNRVRDPNGYTLRWAVSPKERAALSKSPTPRRLRKIERWKAKGEKRTVARYV